jgi:hypothetical protein
MRYMERKQIAIVLAVVIIVAGAAYFLVLDPTSSTFHFEENYPSTDRLFFLLFLSDLEDTTIVIKFANDSTLWYSMDILLYEPARASTAFEMSRTDSTYLGLGLAGIARIQSINVTLGNAVSLSIAVEGENLTTSLTYDNGAKLGSSQTDLSYRASGILDVTFTEDVTFSELGAEMRIAPEGSPYRVTDVVYMSIDLPEGLNGDIRLNGDTNRHTYQLDGWSFTGVLPLSPRYSTDPTNPSPLLDIYIHAGTAHLWLSD